MLLTSVFFERRNHEADFFLLGILFFQLTGSSQSLEFASDKKTNTTDDDRFDDIHWGYFAFGTARAECSVEVRVLEIENVFSSGVDSCQSQRWLRLRLSLENRNWIGSFTGKQLTTIAE